VTVEERDGIYRLTRPADESLGGRCRCFEPLCFWCINAGAETMNWSMRTFIHTRNRKSSPADHPMNSGVKLVTQGSEVIDDLRALEKESVEILACGTCLGHFGLKDAVEVGRISNMYEITMALMKATKVISI
jgi:hypothetical protein